MSRLLLPGFFFRSLLLGSGQRGVVGPVSHLFLLCFLVLLFHLCLCLLLMRVSLWSQLGTESNLLPRCELEMVVHFLLSVMLDCGAAGLLLSCCAADLWSCGVEGLMWSGGAELLRRWGAEELLSLRAAAELLLSV